MDNLFEFVFGVYPFALAFGVAGVAAGIWEHIDAKKERQQAKNKRRTKIRHAKYMDKFDKLTKKCYSELEDLVRAAKADAVKNEQ